MSCACLQVLIVPTWSYWTARSRAGERLSKAGRYIATVMISNRCMSCARVHVSHAEALEPTGICELPYARLQQVILEVPALHRQLMRVISREIIAEHRHTVMMGRQQAQEQLAIFLKNLTDRYQRLQRNSNTLTLSMSRYDIANYLGLVVETVSRLFSRMKEMGVLEVDRKSVHILRPDLLADLAQNGSISAAKRRDAG